MRLLVPTLLLCAITCAVAVPPAVAAEKSSKKTSDVPALYRYRNSDGVVVMERSIPPEYTTKGYEILNSFGQVIQTVAPVTLLTDEERKAKADMEAMSSRKDSELRKLYSSPADAERLRDRQLEALGLKIEHAKGQLGQTAAKRKAAVEEAARMERAGNKVPPAKRETIERLTLQVNAQEAEIKGLQQEQVRIRQQFEPILGRLRVIYPDKAGTPAVPAVAPVTAAAQAPAAAAPAQPAAKAPVASVVPAAAATAKPIAVPVVSAAKPAAVAAQPVPVAPPKPALAQPASPVAPPAKPAPVKPVAAPVAPAVQPKPVPVVAAPKPVLGPPVKPAPPAVPPVVPVSKVQSTPKPANKASTEEEKAAAKAKAKAEMGLEEEPRSAGGLRPTGF